MSRFETADTRPGLVPQRHQQTANPHDSLGRYLLIALIGEGGMGTVYEAFDPQLQRPIAIKILHANTGLQREAQAMAALSHPNVVPVYDVGECGGRPFIAMERVQGETLREWLDTPRTTAEILRVFEQAGRGLAAVHDAGMVHLDFKPENVLIGDDGRVRVTDFGLALLDPSSPDDSAQGTPAYMAPEQMLGEPLDPRADQYSFCVALWEALFGGRPYQARSFAALAAQVLAAHLPPRPETPSVPPRVWHALRRGLDRNRELRFSGMEELLAFLVPPRARPRRRWWGAVAAALTLIGVASAVPAIDATRSQLLTSNASALDAYLEGEMLLNRNQVRLAQFRYESAVERDPGFALAHFRIAYARDYRGVEGAREALDHAFRLMETVDDDVRMEAGKELLLMDALDAKLRGNRLGAVALLHDILATYPDDKEATFLIGDILFHGGDPDGAVRYFERVVKKDPTFERALGHLMHAHLYSRHPDRARAWIPVYLDLTPTAAGYQRAGEAYLILGDFEAARSVLERGGQLYPGNEAIQQSLVGLHLFTGDTETADGLIAAAKPTAYIHRWRVWRHAYHGEYERVDQEYRRLINRGDFPDSKDISRARSLAEYAYFVARFRGDRDRAEQLIQEALIEGTEEDRYVAFYAAQVRHEEVTIPELERRLRQSTQFRPVIALSLAEEYRKQERYDEALVLVRRNLERRRFNEYYTFSAAGLLQLQAELEDELGFVRDAAATRARLRAQWAHADQPLPRR